MQKKYLIVLSSSLAFGDVHGFKLQSLVSKTVILEVRNVRSSILRKFGKFEVRNFWAHSSTNSKMKETFVVKPHTSYAKTRHIVL